MMNMKTKKMVLALAATGMIGAIGYTMYALGVSHGSGTAAPSSAAAEDGRKILYWHDPMVPGQKFDRPGKSPYMDMPLVPVYADGAVEQGTVSISPQVQQNLGVRTAEVTLTRLAPAVEAVGSVAYNERAVALVQARSNGFVERLHVRAPLDPVRKGQPLVELYVPEWVAAQEEFLAARRMQGIAGLADAARQRMRLAGMTDDQIRQVERTSRVSARMTISAPASGVVAELAVREGMTVSAGAPLFRINGLDSVWVIAEVPESLLARVQAGDPVHARPASLPGTSFMGKVSAILPEVNPATRTVKARIELPNPGHQLLPGMFVNVRFTGRSGHEVLAVPSEAIIQTGVRSVVMVAQGSGKFVPVDVETGSEAGGLTEIRKGLSAGQKVVTSGQFLVDSEANLKGAVARMGTAPAAGHEGHEVAPALHKGEGKVEAVAKDEITFSHGPIPTMKWPAMTMSFDVQPGVLRPGIKVGDTVRFEFTASHDGKYVVTSVVPVTGAAK